MKNHEWSLELKRKVLRGAAPSFNNTNKLDFLGGHGRCGRFATCRHFPLHNCKSNAPAPFTSTEPSNSGNENGSRVFFADELLSGDVVDALPAFRLHVCRSFVDLDPP